MPAGGQAVPGKAPAAPGLSDDQVNLLYRTGLGPLRFSAELREWADTGTMTRPAGAAFASTDLGRRTHWLWQGIADQGPDQVDEAALVQVAMPGRYRIETITDPGRRPVCIACDGEHLWRAYPDRVAVRPAEPPPRAIAQVIDPAWLLHPDVRVLAVDDAAGSGRAALRVVAAADPAVSRPGRLSGSPMLADRVEALIDAELGIVLRQVRHCEGHPLLRAELSEVTAEVDPAAFRIEPPPGTPVITGGLLAEAGLSQAGAALLAVKGVTVRVTPPAVVPGGKRHAAGADDRPGPSGGRTWPPRSVRSGA